MKFRSHLVVLASAVLLSLPAAAADHLQLNPNLDYQSDSADGPLISGTDMSAGAVAGQPNYVIIYGEQCFNSKRQARRTVQLYDAYKTRVNFVVIDLDRRISPGQQELVRQYYTGSIPHVTVLGRDGHAVYDRAGEVPSEDISSILDQALR